MNALHRRRPPRCVHRGLPRRLPRPSRRAPPTSVRSPRPAPPPPAAEVRSPRPAEAETEPARSTAAACPPRPAEAPALLAPIRVLRASACTCPCGLRTRPNVHILPISTLGADDRRSKSRNHDFHFFPLRSDTSRTPPPAETHTAVLFERAADRDLPARRLRRRRRRRTRSHGEAALHGGREA